MLSKIRPRPRWGDESAADPWGDNDQGRVAAVGDFDRKPAGFHANFAIAAVALVLVVGGGVLLLAPHQKHSASRTSRPDPRPLQAPSGPPSPEEFSDPRAYAAALTRYSLGSGGTNVLDRPDCGSRLTWTDWTCTVRAKATNGPFVGVVLTYRCYPIGHGVVCGPKNPPPLVAAGGS